MHGRQTRKKMEREQKKLQVAMRPPKQFHPGTATQSPSARSPSARSPLGGGSPNTSGSPAHARSPMLLKSPKSPKSLVSPTGRDKAGAKPGTSPKGQTLGSPTKGGHQSSTSRDPEGPPVYLDLSMPSHVDTAKAPLPSSRKKVVICACASAVLVVVVAVVAMSLLFGHKGWIGLASCATEECARVNAMLMEARNESVAPCDNFYQHVCGRWSLNHSGYSVYDMHTNAFLNKLSDTLINTLVRNQESPSEKVARFYQTCTTVVVEGRDQTAELHEAFARVGILWPRLGTGGDAYIVEAKVHASFLVSSLLTIRWVKDFGGEVYVHISPGNCQAVWRRNLALLFPDSPDDDSTYRRYYESAFQAYAPGMAGAVDFDTFRDIEEEVYNKTYHAQSDKGRTNLTSLAQLSNVIRYESAQQLTKFVMATYNLPIATNVTVKGPEYLKRFGELVGELGDDKVIFYLGYVLLQLLWRVLERRTNLLWHKHFSSRVSSRIQRQQEADCLEFTELMLGWALFYRFMDENSGANTTEMVDTMAENIGRAFVQQLSFNHIFYKLVPAENAFKELVFYRKRFTEANLRQRLDSMDDMTDSLVTNWLIVANTRRMMSEEDWSDMATYYVWWLRTKHGYTLYNTIRKTLRGPPLYGELPLFGEQSTEAVNYGALGTTMGEAGVRLIERKFVDAKKMELTDRMHCVYKANPEIPRSTKEPVYRSAAVDIVYDAFKEAASKRKQQDLRNFGREQAFFQMMCYVMCEGSLKDAKVPELSCNQAVKDSHHFGKVFGCPIGSPMNPTPKCRLFY